MLYGTETLPEIYKRVMKTLEAEDLPFSFRGLLGTAISGLSYMLHGHLENIQKQMSLETATKEALDSWARVFGLERKKREKPLVTIGSSGPKGLVIPCEWIVDGENFFAIKDFFYNEKGLGEVVCSGEKLSDQPKEAALRVAHKDIETQGKILDFRPEILAETDESLRERILLSIRSTQRSGTIKDYIAWSLEVPGVDEAFVLPGHLYVEGKQDFSGYVFVTWLSKNEREEKITKDRLQKELQSKAPATAVVEVKEPIKRECRLEIKLKENTDKHRTTITKKVNAFFKQHSKPGLCFDKTLNQFKTKISKAEISAVISSCSGGKAHELSLDKELEVHFFEVWTCQIVFA